MTITDLTNTTWKFNDTIDVTSSSLSVYIDFDGFGYSQPSGTAYMISGNIIKIQNNELRYYLTGGGSGYLQYDNSGWTSIEEHRDLQRTIHFTGGQDVTYTSFINWLLQNATCTYIEGAVPNKVIYNGNTLIDLTQDTITPSRLISGYTAHDASGAPIVGVAKGENVMIKTMEEFTENYDNPLGFIVSYNNVTTGKTYVTNSVTTSKGVLVETTSADLASAWFFEATETANRYAIYTYLTEGGDKYYIYNNTASNANFIGLSTTTKALFDVSFIESTKFLFKISTKNAWIQHSNSGGGIRLYTDHNNRNNSEFSFEYIENAIVPFGTLEITENGTYDVSQYKTVIVNI